MSVIVYGICMSDGVYVHTCTSEGEAQGSTCGFTKYIHIHVHYDKPWYMYNQKLIAMLAFIDFLHKDISGA